MSALVAATACLCALSAFVATGFARAEARDIAMACRRETALILAVARSLIDAVAARVRRAAGARDSQRVTLGEVSEMIDVVRLGLSAGLSFDAALGIFASIAHRCWRSDLSGRAWRGRWAWERVKTS